MDDKDIEFAVKLYKKKAKDKDFTIEEFAQEIVDHKNNRPGIYRSYDPLSLYLSIKKLWNVLEMSMSDLVDGSGYDMAKFSRRFCIPYRTLQAWCDGTNPCPVYTKLMICEILKMMPSRTVYDKNCYNIMQN